MAITSTLTLDYLVTAGEVGNVITLDYTVLEDAGGGAREEQGPYIYPEEVYRRLLDPNKGAKPSEVVEEPVEAPVIVAKAPQKPLESPSGPSAAEIAADVAEALRALSEAAQAQRDKQERIAADLLRATVEKRKQEELWEEEALLLLLAA